MLSIFAGFIIPANIFFFFLKMKNQWRRFKTVDIYFLKEKLLLGWFKPAAK